MDTSTLSVGTDLSAELGECEVGDEKTLSVTGTVKSKGGDGSIELDVTDVSYEDGHEYEDGEEEEMAGRSQKHGKPSAVVLMIGKDK